MDLCRPSTLLFDPSGVPGICEMALVAKEPCPSGQSSLTHRGNTLASLAGLIQLDKEYEEVFRFLCV